jgi:2-haloacid dehalogenase
MKIPLNKYKFLIFDVDETLLDFRKSEHWAFHQTLNSHGILENHAQLFKSYRQISTALWDQLEKNLISKDKLKVHRYELLLQEHSLDEHNPESLSEQYLHNLTEKVFLIDQALEVCKHLAQTHTLGIITNGIESVQKSRLQTSGLTPYFSDVVVSEQCGFAKPDPRIFQYTLNKNGFTPQESLMIGDKLEADILGANNVHMDSCWVNLNGAHKNISDIRTQFEISHLKQLIDP